MRSRPTTPLPPPPPHHGLIGLCVHHTSYSLLLFTTSFTNDIVIVAHAYQCIVKFLKLRIAVTLDDLAKIKD